MDAMHLGGWWTAMGEVRVRGWLRAKGTVRLGG